MTGEKILTYKKSLPKEVIDGSLFCVCRVGSKVGFNPKELKLVKPSTEDDFLPWDIIEPYLSDQRYGEVGIKVGTGGVCAIDIDNVVSGTEISEMAIDIIEHFHSYTELSPSMTGIRILFHSKAIHNYERYYTKNSAIGVESYPINNNGRMVRLTGLDLTGYEYRELTEDEYVEFLEKYMVRPSPQVAKNNNIIWDEDNVVSPERIEALKYLIRKDQMLRSMWTGNYYTERSGSEIDFAIIMQLAKITNKYSEIKAVFEAGRWFKLRTTNTKTKRDHTRTMGEEFTYKWYYRNFDYLKTILKMA